MGRFRQQESEGKVRKHSVRLYEVGVEGCGGWGVCELIWVLVAY